MKNIYIEQWKNETVFAGKLMKINLEKLAKEMEVPEILEMDEDEFSDWWSENEWDAMEMYPETQETILEGENYSDPDCFTSIYTNNQELLDNDSTWRGFYKALGYREVDNFKERLANEQNT